MAHAASPTIRFVDALWPARGVRRAPRAALLAILGSALLTLFAKAQVPFAIALVMGGAAVARRRLAL
jgi:hypothetical protein